MVFGVHGLMVGFLRSMVLWFKVLGPYSCRVLGSYDFRGFTWVFGFRGWDVRVLGS